jgi:hypothetical protein
MADAYWDWPPKVPEETPAQAAPAEAPEPEAAEAE